MKAIVCTKYGTPEVLRLQEVEKPVPKSNEVRIKVRAGTVGPSDCAFRKSDPLLIRFIYGFRKPKYSILGAELAGEVESVGAGVASFKAGDQVFGLSAKTFGVYAEYMCLPEAAPLIVKPAGLTYEEAVAVCDGALTALTFLRDKAKVRSGQRVLINGASGAVGIYAVQLAKHYGAEVTGVCSAANAELVKTMGADRVIDYGKEDFTASGQTYDVIFDAVGKRTYGQCKRALTPKGIYLSTVPSASILFNMLRTAASGGRKAIFATAGLMQNKENLAFISELCDTGALRPVIDRRYPLEQTAEAHRYVDTGRKKGNVVIVIGG
ncbi:NAD(P)-dependent alcohol dehydrogenase [Cohnella sp. CIP 111063]|uniref:NAD(P)-dependent alcohol dehydrogenase n=1 Tax=unclassified Cohnella TaxID=2636738 RepID=UPI000B8BF608|nr:MULTISPECIES: NAD(P)-dependent alcohol dehydrogenase [unclassified Cohnella]OXS58068.1 NAD(P)-dependent alcohol dehydrogenase [Cohnella sp. CIP 111063]PRX71410.1 NADPH2:quinone reductase [Cohnella sp. SGD-V74]